MTWDAFKKEVDKQIKEKGLGDLEIDYIDWIDNGARPRVYEDGTDMAIH